MAYPLSIASLHFQYKTAFDVLKAYMPDKNDDELSQMVLDFKTKKDADKPPKKAPTESTPKKESKKAPKKEAVTPPSDAPKKDAETTTETPAESPPSDAPKKESKKESKTKKPKV